MPPLLIQVADKELLFDDATRLHEKASASGVNSRLHVYPGLPHDWHMFIGTVPEAGEALQEIADFVKEKLVEEHGFIRALSPCRENALYRWWYNLARMFERTFFVTTVASGRKPVLRSVRVADLFIETMYEYRKQGKFLLHEFVVMPDHLHMLLTPAMTVSLERCLQYIKGGFSFRCSKELQMKWEVW